MENSLVFLIEHMCITLAFSTKLTCQFFPHISIKGRKGMCLCVRVMWPHLPTKHRIPFLVDSGMQALQGVMPLCGNRQLLNFCRFLLILTSQVLDYLVKTADWVWYCQQQKYKYNKIHEDLKKNDEKWKSFLRSKIAFFLLNWVVSSLNANPTTKWGCPLKANFRFFS